MVRRRAWETRGLAAIFDALMFLAAMVALCSIFPFMGDRGEDEGIDRAGYVAKVHSVLLRLTLEIIGEGEAATDAHVRVLELVRRDEHVPSRWRLPIWAEANVTSILQGLMGPGWSFEWCMAMGQDLSVLAASGGVPMGQEVFSSDIGHWDAGLDQRVEFILKGWRT